MHTQKSQCPSCGGINLHVSEWYSDDGDTSYFMVCDDCGYEDPDRFEEEYVALDHWNRRVVKGYLIDDPTDTEYDQLEDFDEAVVSEDELKIKKSKIRWSIDDRRFGASSSIYREPHRRHCKCCKNEDDEE